MDFSGIQSDLGGVKHMAHAWDEIDQFRGTLVKGEWPTLPELFEMAYKRYPENPCFVSYEPDRVELNYTEVYLKIRRAAAYMKDRGITKGSRVLLCGGNSMDWAIGYYAVLFAGATLVPIDNTMHADKCTRLCKYAKVTFAICDFEILEKLSKVEDSWFGSLNGKLLLKGKTDKYDKLLTLENDPITEKYPLEENDWAAILFTSGTTGNEKGAVLTHRNITSNTYQAADFIPYLDEHEVFYALLPLHHAYCCTTTLHETVRFGAQCIFGHGIVVSRMINDMKKGHVTVFMGIPMLYNKVLDGVMSGLKKKGKLTYGLVLALMNINGWCVKVFKKGPFNGFFKKNITSQIGLDHARLLICGAGPLAPMVFKRYQQLGLPFLQGYGLTEASPVTTLNPPEHFKIESIGKALSFIDLIIGDPDEEGVGEIRIKGPNVCVGYLDDEENTKALFDENGYLRTGDIGSMDSEGYVVLRGRSKNVIVTEGGKNVFPEEIEDMFQLNTEIDQILIRAYQPEGATVPSEHIEAVIYPSPDYAKKENITLEEQKKVIEKSVEEVNRQLVAYKKIERITYVDEPMQMTTTKKIIRRTVK